MPSRAAIDVAVRWWSPVIMTGLMPADAALGDGQRGGLARRVGDGHHAHQAQALLGVLGLVRDGRHATIGQGQHAVAVRGVALGDLARLGQHGRLVRVQQRGDRFEGALDGHPVRVGVAAAGRESQLGRRVERRHASSLGVEADLGHARDASHAGPTGVRPAWRRRPPGRPRSGRP